MKGVSDFFISKDKLAYFWFLVACACVASTAWYVNSIAADGDSRMLYVIMNDQNVMYLDQNLSTEGPKDLFDSQARLALETLLNRGPSGPLNPKRVPKLFTDTALEWVMNDVREQRVDFSSHQFHQMVEVGEIQVLLGEDGGAITVAMGQLIRVGVDQVESRVINEVYSVNARLVWEPNVNMRDSKLFPFVCREAKYALSLISES